jgi:hypothetical protein
LEKKHQESRYESTAPDLEHQQPTKEKKHTKVNKKTPTKGDKTPTGGERNLHFFELPKRKYQKGGGEPFEKIKEREERKQRRKRKKEKKEVGRGTTAMEATAPQVASFFFFSSSWRGQEQ